VTKKLKLTDRLHALELFGKATGFLNVKEQPVSPLEAFGAEALLTIREELRQRIAARRGLTNQGGTNDCHRSCPKHRAKLRMEQCSRLDVWIGAWIVEGIRQLAKRKGRETWLEAQDVLEQHLLAHGAGPSGAPADSKNQPESTTN
jgi:hypothetical protein